MLSWLRGLMNGDQSSVTADGVVTRDAHGRVVQVQQTLSPPGQKPAGDLPTLVIGPELEALVPAAGEWLAEQNMLLARRFGIGSENSFLFDQESGTLTLSFKGGRQLVAQAQVLGSFDPADRTFLWGWANPSIQPALTHAIATLRDQPPTTGENPFATSRHSVQFDNVTALLAVAGQKIGADGIYRGIGDSMSLFLSIEIDPDTRIRPDIDEAQADEAVALVNAYDAEMLPFDRTYGDEIEDDDAKVDALLDGKIEVHGRYWTRDDDYWTPSSLGWPSDHDASLHDRRFVVPYGRKGLLCITIAGKSVQTIYRLQPVDGALRIVDQLLDWGDGFLWPGAKPVPRGLVGADI